MKKLLSISINTFYVLWFIGGVNMRNKKIITASAVFFLILLLTQTFSPVFSITNNDYQSKSTSSKSGSIKDDIIKDELSKPSVSQSDVPSESKKESSQSQSGSQSVMLKNKETTNTSTKEEASAKASQIYTYGEKKVHDTTIKYFTGGVNFIGQTVKSGMVDGDLFKDAIAKPNIQLNSPVIGSITPFYYSDKPVTSEPLKTSTLTFAFSDSLKNTTPGYTAYVMGTDFDMGTSATDGGVLTRTYKMGYGVKSGSSISNMLKLDVKMTMTPTPFGTVKIEEKFTNNTGKDISNLWFYRSYDTNLKGGSIKGGDAVPIYYIGNNVGYYITDQDKIAQINFYFDRLNGPDGWIAGGQTLPENSGLRKDPDSILKGKKATQYESNVDPGQAALDAPANTMAYDPTKDPFYPFADSSFNMRWDPETLKNGESRDIGWEMGIEEVKEKPVITLDQAPKMYYQSGDVTLTGAVSDADNKNGDEKISYSVNGADPVLATTVKNSAESNPYEFTIDGAKTGLKPGDKIDVYAEDEDFAISNPQEVLLVEPEGTPTLDKKVRNVTANETEFKQATDASAGDTVEYALNITADSKVNMTSGTIVNDTLATDLTFVNAQYKLDDGTTGDVAYDAKTGNITIPKEVAAGHVITILIQATINENTENTINNNFKIVNSNYGGGYETSEPAVVNISEPYALTSAKLRIGNLTTSENTNLDEDSDLVSASVNDQLIYTYTLQFEGSERGIVKKIHLTSEENAASHTDADGAISGLDLNEFKIQVDDGAPEVVTIKDAIVDQDGKGITINLPGDIAGNQTGASTVVHGNSKVKISFAKSVTKKPAEGKFHYTDGSVTIDDDAATTQDLNSVKFKRGINDNVHIAHYVSAMTKETTQRLTGFELSQTALIHNQKHFDQITEEQTGGDYPNQFLDYYVIKADDLNKSEVSTSQFKLNDILKSYYINADSTPGHSQEEAPIEVDLENISNGKLTSDPTGYNLPGGLYHLDKDGKIMAPEKNSVYSFKDDVADSVANSKDSFSLFRYSDIYNDASKKNIKPGESIVLVVPRKMAAASDASLTDGSRISKILDRNAIIGGYVEPGQEDIDVKVDLNANDDGTTPESPNFNETMLMRPKTSSVLNQTIQNVTKGDPDADDPNALYETNGKAGDIIKYTYEMTASADNQDYIGLEGLIDAGSDHWDMLELVPGSITVNGVVQDGSVESNFINNRRISNPDSTTPIEPGQKLKITYEGKLNYSADDIKITSSATALNARLWYPFTSTKGNTLDLPWAVSNFVSNDAEKTQRFNDTYLDTNKAHYTLQQDVKNVTMGQNDALYGVTSNAVINDIMRYRFKITTDDTSAIMKGSQIKDIVNAGSDGMTGLTAYQKGTLYAVDNAGKKYPLDDSQITNDSISLPFDIDKSSVAYVYYDVKVLANATVEISNSANYSVTQGDAGPTFFNETTIFVTAIHRFSLKQQVKNDTRNEEWQTDDASDPLGEETGAAKGNKVSFRFALNFDEKIDGRDANFAFSIHHLKLDPDTGIVPDADSIKIQYLDASGNVTSESKGKFETVTNENGDSDTKIEVPMHQYETGDKMVVTYQADVNEDIADLTTNYGDMFDEILGRYFAYNKTKINRLTKGTITMRYIDADSDMKNPTEIADSVSHEGTEGEKWFDVMNKETSPKKIDGWTVIEENNGGDLTNNSDWVNATHDNPTFEGGKDYTITYRYRRAMLSIATPENWEFGDYSTSATDADYNLRAPRDANKQPLPYGVSVLDYYGVDSWHLTVQQDKPFTGNADSSHVLEDSQFRFNNAFATQKREGGNATDDNYGVLSAKKSFALDETTEPVTIMSFDQSQVDGYQKAGDTEAEGKEYLNPGFGVYRYQFGDKSQADYSVQLHVPATTKRYEDHYSTTLTWSLAVGPGQVEE